MNVETIIKILQTFFKYGINTYLLTNTGCQKNTVTCNDVNSGSYCKK